MDFGDGVDPLDANPPEPDDRDIEPAEEPPAETADLNADTHTGHHRDDGSRAESEPARTREEPASGDAGSHQRTATVETGNVFEDSAGSGEWGPADDRTPATDGPDRRSSSVSRTSRRRSTARTNSSRPNRKRSTN